MTILAIETSCDETAVCVLRAVGEFPNARYETLGHALFSQTDIHRQYGGVFPAVAKREHARTLVPMLEKALKETWSKDAPPARSAGGADQSAKIKHILARELGLANALFAYLKAHPEKPAIDGIAVTVGPGLEPALWVGINFAKALALVWNAPLVPVNHMNGHIFISLLENERLAPVSFPALALLISGGHTQLVLMKKWNEYALVGETRDDAVGEAFDKVARMLGLPYPGGPAISILAEEARTTGVASEVTLPRPMIASDDYDFSFSGLKTAALYALRKRLGEHTTDVPPEIQKEVALEFENAVADVLVAKTKRAMDEHSAQTLILGGGVAANTHIRRSFSKLFAAEYSNRTLYLPKPRLTTDNAVMIALAAHAHPQFVHCANTGDGLPFSNITANSNLSLATH